MIEVKKEIKKTILLILSLIFAIFLLSFFDYLVKDYCQAILDENYLHICVFATSFTIFTLLLFVLFLRQNSTLLYTLSFVFIVIILILELIFYFLNNINIFSVFSNIELFVRYLSSFGLYSVFIFILIQYLQVVILPIPSIISIGAGVMMFGPLKCAIYSLIGIVLGSLSAFIMGRKFGKNLLIKIFGKTKIDKMLNYFVGKDKVLLVFMYLFPLFPDDLMCFVAGISSFSFLGFAIVIIVVRLITIFISCYSINNSIIPYNTWWGLVVWALIFVFMIIAYLLINKEIKNKRNNQSKTN